MKFSKQQILPMTLVLASLGVFSMTFQNCGQSSLPTVKKTGSGSTQLLDEPDTPTLPPPPSGATCGDGSLPYAPYSSSSDPNSKPVKNPLDGTYNDYSSFYRNRKSLVIARQTPYSFCFNFLKYEAIKSGLRYIRVSAAIDANNSSVDGDLRLQLIAPNGSVIRNTDGPGYNSWDGGSGYTLSTFNKEMIGYQSGTWVLQLNIPRYNGKPAGTTIGSSIISVEAY